MALMIREDGDPLSTKGRFLSVDPTWESADLGNPQSWNRYSYVGNNPVNNTDPDGRCAVPEACPEPPPAPTVEEQAVDSFVPKLPIVLDPLNRPLETLGNVIMIATLITPFVGDEPAGRAAGNTVRTMSREEARVAAQRANEAAMVEANSGARSQRPATMVGATRPAIGETVVGRSRPGANGCCAEADAANKLSSNAAERSEIVFSTPTRPRTGQPIPVCSNCRRLFLPSQFPRAGGGGGW